MHRDIINQKSPRIHRIAIGTLMGATVLVAFGCGSIIKGNVRTEVKRGERVSVTVQKRTTEEAFVTPLVAAVVPKAIDLAVKQVEKEIAREKKRYSASWSGSVSEVGFYESTAAQTKIALEGLTIERVVTPDKGKPSETAFLLEMRVIPSAQHTHFRFVPERLEFNYAKAKAVSGDKHIDVAVSITMHSHWIDDKGTAHVSSTTLPPMDLRGLELETAWEFDNAIKPTSPKADRALATLTTGWFPRIPRTPLTTDQGSSALYDTGVYTFEVRVDERDDFEKRVEQVERFVEDNKDDVSEKLGSAILNALGIEDATE